MSNPICCLCGNECENEFGNNPYPIMIGGKCCNDCNATKVIPARLAQVAENKKENTDNLEDLLKQTITNNNTNIIETVKPLNEKENTDKNIYMTLNESTGEISVGLASVYENELVNDLEILEAVQERISKKKEEIKNFIEKNKTGSFKTNRLAITYTSATTTTSIDTKLLKSELPDVAAKYSKVSSKASSVSIKTRE